MQTLAIWSLSLFLTLTSSASGDPKNRSIGIQATPSRTSGARQLAAVRGEITKVSPATKGMLLITVRPAKDFQEVTVLARENDLVGFAVSRSHDTDLLGLLPDDARDDEMITAAELNEGDVVSVIYDPQFQNRALEIYIR